MSTRKAQLAGEADVRVFHQVTNYVLHAVSLVVPGQVTVATTVGDLIVILEKFQLQYGFIFWLSGSARRLMVSEKHGITGCKLAMLTPEK